MYTQVAIESVTRVTGTSSALQKIAKDRAVDVVRPGDSCLPGGLGTRKKPQAADCGIRLPPSMNLTIEDP